MSAVHEPARSPCALPHVRPRRQSGLTGMSLSSVSPGLDRSAWVSTLGGPRVRIHLPPAESPRTTGSWRLGADCRARGIEVLYVTARRLGVGRDCCVDW